MIGYYVHHHGLGHLTRARGIAGALDLPVVVLSSLPAPADLAPFAGWVQLPRDDADPSARELQAHGALHWAPLDAPGYRDRMGVVAQWVRDASPDAVVVDVSVEIATLCRLLGVAVVVVAGPGVRDDAPHVLVHRLADRLIAPWPQAVLDPEHLHAGTERTEFVGAFSRFDDRTPSAPPGERRVLVLFGAGGTGVEAGDIEGARAATPGWSWDVLGLGDASWRADVWDALQRADVVVTHAGQNALAEVAAARRPAVVVPQDRPFAEQRTTAQALREHGIAVVADAWPGPLEWNGVLERARAIGGDHWQRWSTGDGARRAAAVIEKVVAGA